MKLLNHQKDLFFTTFELISQAEGSGPAKTNNSRFSGLCPQITVTAINLQIPAEDSTR